MASAPVESAVTYEQLKDLQDDFEEADVELLRAQDKLSKGLFAKRAKLVADIPNFWPLVFEQSPCDVDEYIQPSDAALLLGSLRSLSVERFELPDGDPRSLSIRFDFADNDHFHDKSLEKKFWWRRAKDGWSGLVSEPIDIRWKSPEKDLTGGMLSLARKIWEEDGTGVDSGSETEAKKELKQLMSKTGLGGVSFFAWFGFRGRPISAEESREATETERQKRQARKDGKQTDEADSDSDDSQDEYELEIFPLAEDLALAIAEDLWPGAINYFIQAQEQEAMSDAAFESDDDDDDDMGVEDDDDERHKKRRRNGE
ncbi:NAP family protein [Ophiocordyceps camponoti-floridani]|uniref:NAP family protein n=1 Tax=Ophiocordyceps camponoti-floridani TaxID=2030778 RepID=A0A8H4VCG7_9HYPO|nr:NAP family protein [Ophiocordyceps camponoti-floridani]